MKIQNAFIGFLILGCVLLLAGPTLPYAGASTQKTGAVAGNSGDQAAKTESEPEYTYSPEGKTDPFEAFIARKPQSLSQLPQKGGGASDELRKALAFLDELKRPKTELQTIPLDAISLTSIIKSDGKTVAMVRGPRDAKGYLLKKGTYIGTEGGVVEEIVDEERMTDLGKQLTRKVVVKEPYLDENQKISYRHVELKMPGGYE